MANLEYKDLRKADWQRLADAHGVEYKSKSTIRYLVEKIAEIIGVDDKIVDTEELKSKVCDVLNADSSNETAINENVNDVEVEKDLSLSKLDILRKECDALGLGWNEKHTESDLEQLINAVKGAGISSIELDVNNLDNVLQDLSNAGENAGINTSIESDIPQTPEAFNPIVENAGMQTFNDTQQRISQDPTEVDEANLDIYRKSFTQTIRGHFRLMSLNEIKDLFNPSSYPFKHEIKRHPHNSNQIEIILTSSGKSKRIPSDNEGDWITING